MYLIINTTTTITEATARNANEANAIKTNFQLNTRIIFIYQRATIRSIAITSANIHTYSRVYL